MYTKTTKVAVLAVIAFTLALAIPLAKSTWQGANNIKAQLDARHAQIMRM